MTPPNWDHVDHQMTRDLLEGKITDAEHVEQAITLAVQCLEADADNADVPEDVFATRALAVDACVNYWQIPSTAGVIANLRVFWSV